MEDRKDKNKYMTTNEGEPIYNDTDVLTVGENGPILLKDQQFIDKIAHITRERMPPRVVHAKGSGAKGHFKVFNSMKEEHIQNGGEEDELFESEGLMYFEL